MKITIDWDRPWRKIIVYYAAIMILLLSFGDSLAAFIYQNK